MTTQFPQYNCIIPTCLRDKLLHGAHYATIYNFGDVLSVSSLLPTQQALYESLRMLMVFFSTEQRQVTFKKRQAYGFRDPEFLMLKILGIHQTTYALVG